MLKVFSEKLEKSEFSNNGERFELFCGVQYRGTRYYPYNPASKSGDIVANGIHYQCKAHRGYFGNIANIEELSKHLFDVCKASRYLLQVTETKQTWWLDVDKHEVLRLAELGYITFENAGKRGKVARWSMTVKEAIHLEMRTGIKVLKTE